MMRWPTSGRAAAVGSRSSDGSREAGGEPRRARTRCANTGRRVVVILGGRDRSSRAIDFRLKGTDSASGMSRQSVGSLEWPWNGASKAGKRRDGPEHFFFRVRVLRSYKIEEDTRESSKQVVVVGKQIELGLFLQVSTDNLIRFFCLVACLIDWLTEGL